MRGRVVVVGPDGALLADSAGTDRLGTDYGDRPEVAEALRGDTVQDQRHSETLRQEILATAAPVVEGGRTVGVVRITQSVDAVARATRRAILGLIAIGRAGARPRARRWASCSRGRSPARCGASTMPPHRWPRATSPSAPRWRAAPSSAASPARSTA